MSTKASSSKSSASPLWVLGIVLVIAALLVAYVGLDTSSGSGTLLKPGSVAPPIQALGWLNGGPVSEEQLSGNVVVIDCFASR